MDELDITWFKNQEMIEKKYDHFYKVNLSYLLHMLYKYLVYLIQLNILNS